MNLLFERWASSLRMADRYFLGFEDSGVDLALQGDHNLLEEHHSFLVLVAVEEHVAVVAADRDQ